MQIHNSVYIHVGFPKTGSTFLQKIVFKTLHEEGKINYVNYANSSWRKLTLIGCTPSFSLTDEEVLSLRGLLVNGMVNVISDESLVGSVWMKYCNFLNNSSNLQKIYPEAKIIFTIRNHSDLFKSLYAQFHHEGGISKFERMFLKKEVYNNYWQLLDDVKIPYETFFYSKMITHYENVFQKKNILVLPFEYLLIDKSVFYTSLLDFVGIDYKCYDLNYFKSENLNRSFTQNQIYSSWFFNRFFKSRFNKYGLFSNSLRSKFRLFLQRKSINKLFGSKYEIDHTETSVIKEFFKDDVEKLDKSYKLGIVSELSSFYL